MRDLDFLNAQMVSRPRRDSTARERLAEAAHRKKKAHHKGRNHFHAYQVRLAAKKKAKNLKTDAETKLAKERKFLEDCRKYWSGRRDDLPCSPT